MLLRKTDGKMNHAKLQIFRKIAKLRRWRHAPRLTVTAVAMNSFRHFSKRWLISDVKNITGDDKATLIVNQNSADIAYTFRFYGCFLLRDRDCCSMADGNSRCHGLVQSFFEAMTRCRRKKIAGDNQATLMVDRNSTNITYTFRFYVCLHLRYHNWCSAADGNGSWHGLMPSFFEEMTLCRCQ